MFVLRMIEQRTTVGEGLLTHTACDASLKRGTLTDSACARVALAVTHLTHADLADVPFENEVGDLTHGRLSVCA